jgi:3-methyladenine DNA glycosylase AlkD
MKARLQRDLRKVSTRARAKISQSFFKTGPGEYGEGDRFLGAAVPELRKLSVKYDGLPRKDVTSLLRSRWHEERLLALLILVRQYGRADDADRHAIYKLYLANTRYINNCDLVDLSADRIIGAHLDGRDRALLHKLALSPSVWERRIAMVSAYAFIRRGEFDDALRIAESLLGDDQDLIHKAVGWMLREVGKRDERALCEFLDRHAADMPRTSLRYSLERLSPALRARYMAVTPRAPHAPHTRRRSRRTAR